MSPKKTFQRYPLLYPVSLLYGIGIRIRNKMFDWGLLSAMQSPVPVICIGNLTVGGTGKTPHTEYLITLLLPSYRVAVISRGYKRASSGFILAGPHSTSRQIGDEPFQMKQKFPSLILAVDSNRKRAISRLLSGPEDQRPQVILLDDAFQHRYVTPSLTLLLTDYNRLFYKDWLLPAGRLRENKSGSKRADILIVTKCDPALSPQTYQTISRDIHSGEKQALFFTGILYGNLTPVFTKQKPDIPLSAIPQSTSILLVSGIASPAPLLREIANYTDKVHPVLFPDHHAFTPNDMLHIMEKFKQLPTTDKLIVVTEKDAARLLDNKDIAEDWKEIFYYLPIRIDFRLHQEEKFKEIIYNHIADFERNHIVLKK